MLGLWWGGALFGGCKRGTSASVDAGAFTAEIWAPYSSRTLIEASFDRGLGDRMLLVSHVWWEPAFLELGKGSYGVRDGNSVIPTCVGAHIKPRDDGRHHGTYAQTMSTKSSVAP